jgi:hypothetical protein
VQFLAGTVDQREAVNILHQPRRLLPQLVKCGGFLPIAKKASQQTHGIIHVTRAKRDRTRFSGFASSVRRRIVVHCLTRSNAAVVMRSDF